MIIFTRLTWPSTGPEFHSKRNKQLRDQVADLTERLEAAYGEIRRSRIG
ncbi:hypothetical protein [Kibdelosporangium aridum]|nr:hypothetical protein [Kibdelosporangium aridum]